MYIYVNMYILTCIHDACMHLSWVSSVSWSSSSAVSPHSSLLLWLDWICLILSSHPLHCGRGASCCMIPGFLLLLMQY